MTRQYARRQTRWIRRRFLEASARASSSRPSVYSVNSDDPHKWDEDCLAPAEQLVRAVLAGQPPTMQPEPVSKSSDAKRVTKLFRCDPCGRDFMGEEQFRAHLAGKRHRQVEAKARRARFVRQVTMEFARPVDGEAEGRAQVLKLARLLSGRTLPLEEVKDKLDRGQQLTCEVSSSA